MLTIATGLQAARSGMRQVIGDHRHQVTEHIARQRRQRSKAFHDQVLACEARRRGRGRVCWLGVVGRAVRVFISWSGPRSEKIAEAFEKLITSVFPEMETFLSTSIPSGTDWRLELERNLDASDAIVFCFTPEAVTSGWVMYEAGYMAAKEGVLVRPFVYGTDVPDPLSHIQAVKLNRENVSAFVDDLAAALTPGLAAQSPSTDDHPAGFDKHWPTFDQVVRSLVLLPVSDFVPTEDFLGLFERKTYREPFPECVDARWLDRYDAVSRTRQLLANEGTRKALSTDEYVNAAFRGLERQLDRYQMLIGGALLREVDWEEVPERHQRLLESCRQEIARLVYDFDKPSHMPKLEESIAYASVDTERRKDMIHAFEDKLSNGELSRDSLNGAAQSGWDLDRIVCYIAWQKNKMPSSPAERWAAVRREEERARTRDLMRGLQPLYYALEAFDMLLASDDGLESSAVVRLVPEINDTLEAIHCFVEASEHRDGGGHIRRRIKSISSKLSASR